MSGIVNSTGAVSGVIGTTVGTPVSTDASGLTTGTLAAARMSSGTVIQQTYYERTSQYFDQNSGTDWWSVSSINNCTIDPISSSNYLMLQLSVTTWWIIGTGSTYHGRVKFTYNASDLSETDFGHIEYVASTYYLANTEWINESFNIQKRISMPSANEITIIPYFKLNSDQETYLPASTGLLSLTLSEIKA